MGVGTTSAMVARKRRARLATAAVLLNFCFGGREGRRDREMRGKEKKGTIKRKADNIEIEGSEEGGKEGRKEGTHTYLLWVLDPTKQETATQHQQQVRKHRAQKRGLDDADLVVNEGLHANHHFHGVAKGSVHEPAD